MAPLCPAATLGSDRGRGGLRAGQKSKVSSISVGGYEKRHPHQGLEARERMPRGIQVQHPTDFYKPGSWERFFLFSNTISDNNDNSHLLSTYSKAFTSLHKFSQRSYSFTQHISKHLRQIKGRCGHNPVLMARISCELAMHNSRLF